MSKLSTGEPNTLKTWYSYCKAVFGPDSPATKMIKEKMDDQGPDTEVIASESQLLMALGKIHIERDIK